MHNVMKTRGRLRIPLRAPTDRTVDRLIKGIVVVLAIGIPLIAFLYWSDRHVDREPSLADRNVAAAEEFVRQSPNDVGARVSLAAAYVSAGRYEDGVTQFGEVLKSEPNNRAALLGRGIAYVELEQYDLASADFQRLVEGAKAGEYAQTDPQLEQAYYELGVIALTQSRPGDALEPLKAALAIDGGDADALYSYGTALVATGDPTTGVKALRRAVAFVPSGWCEPYEGLVQGYTALGDATGVAWANGMVDFCNGRSADAEQKLQPLTAGPMSIDALLGLALVAANSGDLRAATAYYDRVLALEPDNVSALIGLGQIGGDAHASMPAASPAAGSN
jgi:tetratricopeptide (TPR) repeat protein